MTIPPDDLERISSDGLEGTDEEALRRKGFRRRGIRFGRTAFPLAKGAGAVTPKVLQPEETLSSIIPTDGQFGSDYLYIHQTERGGHGR